MYVSVKNLSNFEIKYNIALKKWNSLYTLILSKSIHYIG